ncbi:MAG: winged helix-turn-helix domain-containing protein [Caulobacteraceae bacterium]
MTAEGVRPSPASGASKEFGPFRFDIARGLLTREGAPVVLGFKALEILRVLVERAPEVVGKATLMEQVWPGVFVEETALRFHVSALRRALGEDQDGRRYISTASGLGYSFVASLRRVPDARAAIDEGLGDADAPAARTPRTNLPPALSELIGREADLDELGDQLEHGRLVSLVGPGGVGKTRLALELGRRDLDAYMGGVWLVDLAPLAGADAVASALAATLGVAVAKAEATVDTLIFALGKMRTLLIFDNCEHLVEAAAALTRTLLERAVGVSILATSQRPLDLAAEQTFNLSPLEIPPAGATDVAGYAAVRLFIQRAQAADRQFVLDAGKSEGVGEICRRLDGLPLALEMAARRLRVLGVEGLRRGLADRLQVLSASPHGQARHASLLGMLEWSHSLLTPFDQRVFRRLAAFPATFSLEAAVAVASDGETDRWTVVDSLSRLIDQSLLSLESREPARFRLLETLRLYAAAKLAEAGGADDVAGRHARHFVEVFEEAEQCWEETPDAIWIARYQPELENLRTALEWTLAQPVRRQIAITLAGSGARLMDELYLSADGRRWCDRAIPLLDADTSPEIASRLLCQAAIFYIRALSPAETHCVRILETIRKDLDNGPILMDVLVTIASHKSRTNQIREAQDFLDQANRLLPMDKFKKLHLKRLMVCGSVAGKDFRISESRDYFAAALEISRTIRRGFESELLQNLAVAEYFTGNIDLAIELTESAIRIGGRGLMHSNLAAYLLFKGSIHDCRLKLTEAFYTLLERRDYPAVACLQIWAELAGEEGRLVEAAQLIGFVVAERERAGSGLPKSTLPLYERLMSVLDASLAPEEIEILKAQGAAWNEAQAIDFVTTQLLPPPTPEPSAGRAPADQTINGLPR